MGRGQNNESLQLSALSLDEARRGIASMGFSSYEVGGSVRDELLGKEAKDLDVCVVGSSYDEIAKKAEEMGLKSQSLEVAGTLVGLRVYGDWTPPEGIEIALARKEVSTGPGHGDFSFEIGRETTIEEDLRRRDFTCNAIAREIKEDGSLGEWIDPFGGIEDIREGTLRAVSDKMIEEDPLRILRGLARLSKDGLYPDEETRKSMIRWSEELRPDGSLSPERVFSELEKIIEGPEADKAFAFMLQSDRESTIWKNIFPELSEMAGFDQQSRYHDLLLDEHTLLALNVACREGYSKNVRWAALLHDSGKPASAWMGDDGHLHYYKSKKRPGSFDHEDRSAEIARDIMQRLRAPKQTENKVCLLVREHMFSLHPEKKNAPLRARQLVSRIGRADIDELMQLRRCDRAGKGEGENLHSMFLSEDIVARAKEEPTERGDLMISGDDVVAEGVEGEEVGRVLDEILRRVIADPSTNERDRLLRWIKDLAKKRG